MIHIRPIGRTGHQGIELVLPGGASETLMRLDRPVRLEAFDGRGDDWEGTVSTHAYATVSHGDGDLVGTVTTPSAAGPIEVVDRWTADARGVQVERRVRQLEPVAGGAVRSVLEFPVVADGFGEDAQVFAPPAVYDLNDIDGDGIEDYLDTRELVFRDDRLTGLAVLLHARSRGLGIALSREDLPEYDDVPDRVRGQQGFVQRTDIGSLGVVPRAGGWSVVAAYPFVERARCHALTARAREPWGAFWPADGGDAIARYRVSVVRGATAIDSLWDLWHDRAAHLAPRRVELPETVERLTRLRLDALMPYYREDENVAGFVTNCHPQDGVQLEDIVQYGFTGQMVLNALHVLNHADELSDPEARTKGLRTIESFVRRAAASPHGLVHTLYDFEKQRDASWWSGLLLPLAYADEGTNLEELMGPVLDHMRYAIDALSAAPDGTYLRCVAEEHHALLRAYRAERERGQDHPEWMAAAQSFARFLLQVQEEDGSWRRAYTFAGGPLVEPRAWFGRTELNQKSSTATAVPFLHELYTLTGDPAVKDAAVRAARFVAEHFVRGVSHNGGIHDSIYARPQLVDSESILFSLRACLAAADMSGDEDLADAAVDAARLLATWVYLWDVPLPPSSTLARYGFRSTGWAACDTAGAGYIHPYELHAVPDLMEAALIGGDELLATVADLTLHGSNETVATEGKDWGYARPGLQEEGLLVSWWLIDDPMFVDTGFGGRGKGEGNKTCLPWISAVGVDATDVVLERYGTTEVRDAFCARTDAIAH